MVAQFTVKATNSEFAIYFLSLTSCSINRQKSQFYSGVKILRKCYVFWFNVGKKDLLQEMCVCVGREGGGWRPPAPHFLRSCTCFCSDLSLLTFKQFVRKDTRHKNLFIALNKNMPPGSVWVLKISFIKKCVEQLQTERV